MIIKSHSLDQGLASVDGAVLDESIADDGVCECFAAEGNQIDGRRRGSKATIRNVDVECVRDRMMSLKQEESKTSNQSRKANQRLKSLTL
jgi:hypothetical protein